MNPLGSLYTRSRRWPVRLRIAIVSAALTAIILIGFAAVVGRLTSDRLHADFENDLQESASNYANAAEIGLLPNGAVTVGGIDPVDVAQATDAELRIADADGEPLEATLSGTDWGAPEPGSIVSSGGLEIAASLIRNSSLTGPLYIQYARPEAAVNATIGRLWLFLGGGVAIGTLLAGFAGMAVAGRAMRPVTTLTAAARDIANTRDPSRRIPEPENDDEVAELARTFDQMLRQLDAARAETEGTIRRQREFVADASHELRTPLTSILANLELLDHALVDESDEDQRAAVGSALRSSKRMNRLVGDLLLLARADAGRLGGRRRVDLATVAKEALQEVTPVADGHVFEARIDGPAEIEGNPDELHRMTLNLLENAIRHTPSGTAIGLRVDAALGTARLEVSDDGPGLPVGMEEQLFDRFVRGTGPADQSRRSGTGTGLGLSIVRAVASSHGGGVEAGSSTRGGAMFTVRLPLARD